MFDTKKMVWKYNWKKKLGSTLTHFQFLKFGYFVIHESKCNKSSRDFYIF